MKNRIIRLLGEIIVSLVGVILLLSFPNNEISKSLATGFVAAGITAILFEVILKEEFIDELKSLLSPPLKLIDLRENMDRIYLREFRSAKEIDIIALTSENLIRVCGDLIKDKVLSERCRIRIAYLDPGSPLWGYRLAMEPEISPKTMQQILEASAEFYESLAKAFREKSPQIRGSVMVRVYDSIPYFAYFRGDTRIILGFYYSHISGTKSHAFIAEEKTSNLFRMFQEHFEVVWRGQGKEVISIHDREPKKAVEQLASPSSSETTSA